MSLNSFLSHSRTPKPNPPFLFIFFTIGAATAAEHRAAAFNSPRPACSSPHSSRSRLCARTRGRPLPPPTAQAGQARLPPPLLSYLPLPLSNITCFLQGARHGDASSLSRSVRRHGPDLPAASGVLQGARHGDRRLSLSSVHRRFPSRTHHGGCRLSRLDPSVVGSTAEQPISAAQASAHRCRWCPLVFAFLLFFLFYFSRVNM
ncbi:hypothetical protein VPH35_052197 [Triticum aestivum]